MTRRRTTPSDTPEERRGGESPGSRGRFHFYFHRHRRPYWWPEDVSWSPEHPFQPPQKHPFRFRLGCLIPLFFLLSAAGCITSIFVALFPPAFPEQSPHGIFLIPLFGIVLLALALGAILRRMVNPLDEVMEAADRVASGDYSKRLREYGPPQARAFTHSFNTMTERLQAYDEQRKRMLADISHELRTPLTVLQGNLEGMLDNVYPRDEEHITLLLEETRILSRLIEDLRTFSLMETGKLELQMESFDPGRLVRDLANAMRPSAAKNGIAIVDQAEDGLPRVEADLPRIREILGNLISNALRNTPPGGRILIGCRRTAPNADRIEFRVDDNGRGIPPDLLPHVFDRYVKSVDSGGTGLGLAIAKRLVEAHGGGISAESEPGKSTSIRFWIPLQTAGSTA
jgi:signal transduction histidine kinase